jgi:hypothetical protein
MASLESAKRIINYGCLYCANTASDVKTMR